MNSQLRVLIAAGGTGGHLFPALYIAKAIKLLAPNATIEFAGTGRPLEAKIVDANGFKRHIIPSVGINGRGLRGILEFFFTFLNTIKSTIRILNSFKPDVVVGVGGYVTVFPVLMASLKGIATHIHEAEIHPGMANRLLARFVNSISVSFEDATIEPKAKVFCSGQPLRPEMKEFESVTPHNPAPIAKLLILGGSLGAASLDKGILGIVDEIQRLGLQVMHQARAENIEMLSEGYQKAGVVAEVVPFIDEPTKAYRWADVIIARAGASTLAEISLVNKPAIFVPLIAKGDHQALNAQVLVSQGKALMVCHGDAFEERLRGALREIVVPEKYYNMIMAPLRLKNFDAAERIAKSVITLIKADSLAKRTW